MSRLSPLRTDDNRDKCPKCPECPALSVCGVPSVSSQIARPAEVALDKEKLTTARDHKARSRNDGIEVIAKPTDFVRHGHTLLGVAPRPATPGERSTLVVDPKYMPSLALGALREARMPGHPVSGAAYVC